MVDFPLLSPETSAIAEEIIREIDESSVSRNEYMIIKSMYK